jgi:hypothetical protein
MSTSTELTIEQRVAAGAAWLDEHRPGWEREVDPVGLDIASPCNCVLGQLEGNYHDFVDVQSWYDDQAAALGFNGRLNLTLRAIRDEQDALTVEWRRLIESRRAER